MAGGIGANVGPACIAGIVGSGLDRSAVGGLDERDIDNAGWAPSYMQQLLQFVQQIQGLAAVSKTLMRDHEEMALGFRSKLEAAGHNMQAFDEAMVMVFPARASANLPSKRKSKRSKR